MGEPRWFAWRPGGLDSRDLNGVAVVMVGWIAKVLPLFGATLSGLADAITNALTQGTSTELDLRLQGTSLDLYGMDWPNVSIPAAFCGGSGTIALHGGEAGVASTRWQGFPQVHVQEGTDVAYGDLERTGRRRAPTT
jgi:hypothetical protein